MLEKGMLQKIPHVLYRDHYTHFLNRKEPQAKFTAVINIFSAL